MIRLDLKEPHAQPVAGSWASKSRRSINAQPASGTVGSSSSRPFQQVSARSYCLLVVVGCPPRIAPRRLPWVCWFASVPGDPGRAAAERRAGPWRAGPAEQARDRHRCRLEITCHELPRKRDRTTASRTDAEIRRSLEHAPGYRRTSSHEDGQNRLGGPRRACDRDVITMIRLMSTWKDGWAHCPATRLRSPRSRL